MRTGTNFYTVSASGVVQHWEVSSISRSAITYSMRLKYCTGDDAVRTMTHKNKPAFLILHSIGANVGGYIRYSKNPCSEQRYVPRTFYSDRAEAHDKGRELRVSTLTKRINHLTSEIKHYQKERHNATRDLNVLTSGKVL